MTNKELRLKLDNLEILYLTIIGEARGEPVEGQIAVGNVIVNRSRSKDLAIKNVCLEPLQFSCWNINNINRNLLMELANGILLDRHDMKYKQIYWIAEGFISQRVNDNTNNSHFYMTTDLFKSTKRPKWSNDIKGTPTVIGNHTFFNV